MRNIRQYFEQLEEAGRFLNKETKSGARLALVLLDNLAELLMYRKVQDEFRRDDMFSTLHPPRYSASKRRKVAEDFGEKVNFLVNCAQVLDSDAGMVLKVGHILRNEAYHRGIMRDRILVPVARVYFQVVCNLITPLWPGHYGYSALSELTDFLGIYGIKRRELSEEVLQEISSKVAAAHPVEVGHLAENLAWDIEYRVDELLEALDYLAADSGLERESQDDVLKWLLFWANGIGDADRNWPRIQELLAAFKPTVTTETLKRWRERGTRLAKETHPGRALEKWHALDDSLHALEEITKEAVVQLDEHINSQIHDR